MEREFLWKEACWESADHPSMPFTTAETICGPQRRSERPITTKHYGTGSELGLVQSTQCDLFHPVSLCVL